jgi:hypothetical protein
VYREKSKFVRKKWKMMLGLNVQFSGSVINLLVSRDEATLVPSLATYHKQIWLQSGETPPERARHTVQDRKIMVTIARNPLGFPLIVAPPKGRTLNTGYYRDTILAALTHTTQRTTGESSLFMLTMQGLTLLKNIELFAKKMDSGSLPIHPTHLNSRHPTSFCSIITNNVSKEWCFHHMMNYSTQLVKW